MGMIFPLLVTLTVVTHHPNVNRNFQRYLSSFIRCFPALELIRLKNDGSYTHPHCEHPANIRKFFDKVLSTFDKNVIERKIRVSEWERESKFLMNIIDRTRSSRRWESSVGLRRLVRSRGGKRMDRHSSVQPSTERDMEYRRNQEGAAHPRIGRTAGLLEFDRSMKIKCFLLFPSMW